MSSLEKLKPHLEILEKVQRFELRSEYNRFLLILTISGFIAIIGGWISYIIYRFLNIDTTFFMFGMSGNPDISPFNEPILFLSVWLLYAIPILSIIILTTGSSGIQSWNKAYQKIGILAVCLFFIIQIIILVLGTDFIDYIILIWAIITSIGFFTSSYIIFKETQLRSTRTPLILFGIMSFFLGLISFILLPNELSMLFFGTFLGITLSLSGFFLYIKAGKL